MNENTFWNRNGLRIVVALSSFAIAVTIFCLGYGIAYFTGREPDTQQPITMLGRYCFKKPQKGQVAPRVYVVVEHLENVLIYRLHGLPIEEDPAPVNIADLQCGDPAAILMTNTFARYGSVYVYETQLLLFRESEDQVPSQMGSSSDDSDAGIDDTESRDESDTNGQGSGGSTKE